MSYTASWMYPVGGNRLQSQTDWIHALDLDEVADALRRRWALAYTLVNETNAGGWISADDVASLRQDVIDLLSLGGGQMGGVPSSPTKMEWLWPDGPDADKIIVAGSAGSGEVNLFVKINGTTSWTDPSLTVGDDIRAIHLNELREAVESLRVGRWELPIYFSGGLYSTLPDTPWFGGMVANTGTDELRGVGFAVLRDGSPVKGLQNVTVRASSTLCLTTDLDCSLDIHHTLRPIDFVSDLPTWNEYAPGQSLAWTQPGGLGGGDADSIGSMTPTAYQEESLSGTSLQSALQGMVDGEEQTFLIRKTNTNFDSVSFTGRLVIEFQLDSPPN